MDKIYDVVIVGGGASGLMCANFLDKKLNVAIIDKNQIGKKILATGNGRCNFTNIKIEVNKYNNDLVREVIKEFDNNSVISFFKSKGVESYFDEEGRVYPCSDSAKDVRRALTEGIVADIFMDEVSNIKKKDAFEVTCVSGEILQAKKVVVACGNVQIENILRDFSLKVEEKKRVLSGFLIKKNFDKALFGVREDCVVKANVCGKEFVERGQVQFKKDGISGIVIFNLSSFVHKYGKLPIKVTLSLLPRVDEKELKEIFDYRRKNCLDLKVRDALFGLLKPEMANYLIKQIGLDKLDRNISSLTDIEIERIIYYIKNLQYTLIDNYQECQVLSGGVDLKNMKDFQVIEGMYFAGECCNVFGPCGGYNLQWAFSSGYKIAQLINKNN